MTSEVKMDVDRPVLEGIFAKACVTLCKFTQMCQSVPDKRSMYLAAGKFVKQSACMV